MKKLFYIAIAVSLAASACYKPEDNTVNYEDQRSKVVYDLPGDTLASDGWEYAYAAGDTYLRQRFFNSSWTDSIRIQPWGNEKIDAAAGIDGNKETYITWLPSGTKHPESVADNNAYTNTADGLDYIYRSGVWYQMTIDKYDAAKDGMVLNWRGTAKQPPVGQETGWAYCDADNQRAYVYTGKAWALLVNRANYRSNVDFVQVQYSRSGKETGRYNMFLFSFASGKQFFVRDAADSVRYLKTDQWDIAFTETFNGLIWLNNAGYNKNPGYGSPMNKTAVIMYEYGYQFMDQAPADSLFDAVPATDMQIGYTSEYSAGINAWFEYSTATHIAQPFPYRAYYLRLQRIDPATGTSTYRYGKLQLISMYKGAPEVVTDLNWPSPYFTFRYFIQEDGSRNLKTRD